MTMYDKVIESLTSDITWAKKLVDQKRSDLASLHSRIESTEREIAEKLEYIESATAAITLLQHPSRIVMTTERLDRTAVQALRETFLNKQRKGE